MELDELKKQLNRRMAARQQERSAAEIAALLKKDTISVVQKIRRSLWIELFLSILFTIACGLAVAFIDKWAYSVFLAGFGIIGALVSAALVYLLWKTTRLCNTTLPVKANLETIISIIYQYTWLYLRLGMGLLPLCFGLAFWLSYHDPAGVPKPIRWDIFFYMIIALLVFSYISFLFTKWYLKKLYGNYIQQLEILLKEFDEE